MARWFLSTALIGSLLTLSACENLPLDILGELRREKRNREERQDRQRLNALGDRIYKLVGEPHCESVEECRYIGLGAKPCGGPWEYLVYSISQTEPEWLRDMVEEYNDLEAEMNRKYGYVSDCAMAAEPRLGCVEGYCVDLNILPPPPPLKPIHFVDNLDAVPPGDPFNLNELNIQGDVLSAAVGYSGGCAPHEFDLWASPTLTDGTADGLVPEYWLKLTHQANGDMCEAFIQEERFFDLSPLGQFHAGGELVILNVQILDMVIPLEFFPVVREEVPPPVEGEVEVAPARAMGVGRL